MESRGQNRFQLLPFLQSNQTWITIFATLLGRIGSGIKGVGLAGKRPLAEIRGMQRPAATLFDNYIHRLVSGRHLKPRISF